jgi:hypothetical protein
MNKFFFLVLMLCPQSFGNPHWNKKRIPLDTDYSFFKPMEYFRNKATSLKKIRLQSNSSEALRIMTSWDSKTDQFKVLKSIIEHSGTDSLQLRAKKQSALGSFRAKIQTYSKNEVYFDSIGTGQVYKYISNNMSFRFPVPNEDFTFILTAENSITGIQETILTEDIKIADVKIESNQNLSSESFVIKDATKSPSVEFVIFAEGFKSNRKDIFLQNALKTVDVLKNSGFPFFENINFKAVFKESNLKLGSAIDYGNSQTKRDSAYGLYYLYWYKFGRWYHVIYPTDEDYFRQSMSDIPYDYNLFLVDSSEYWGVGNFKTHTAIPTDSGSFIYLLLHELGHFFGLNEEYDGGGPTELQFAQDIQESWSQNMTFLPNPTLLDLKWKSQVNDLATPVPTPNSFWKIDRFGAYSGGYADSNGGRSTYKPGLSCIMESGPNFCKICFNGIADVIKFDLNL